MRIRHRNRLTANIRRADSDLMEVAALLADRLIEVLKPGPQSEDLAEQACSVRGPVVTRVGSYRQISGIWKCGWSKKTTRPIRFGYFKVRAKRRKRKLLTNTIGGVIVTGRREGHRIRRTSPSEHGVLR